ncbi:hypothetical protein QMK19_32975 [Streptomyces sp. H10-C2]|uniref:hypothetical protein n=1 Tax=unclassified Streptomyces TaxID=2593676 RepID=UPI0024BB74DB|nr:MULTISPECIES: hypothetical protein [unclassified Streptomyces]MDJ0345416.1 hypothetical protein [Streptomyces sp. PH10-H1]MDJ0374320.1 hypothetical protein [Streptomyces sp. H10-C2]
MRTTHAIAATAAILLAAGCSSGGTPTVGSNGPGSTSTAARPAPSTVTATTALQKLTTTVPSAKLTVTVTAENDGNHLLGRPGQYTSMVKFADTRIPAADVSFYKKGDVELGGAIEVFPTADDAATRAQYIQTVTKKIPALAEYDYPHGTVLVRLSRFLTPTQAAAYDKAGAQFG